MSAQVCTCGGQRSLWMPSSIVLYLIFTEGGAICFVYTSCLASKPTGFAFVCPPFPGPVVHHNTNPLQPCNSPSLHTVSSPPKALSPVSASHHSPYGFLHQYSLPPQHPCPHVFSHAKLPPTLPPLKPACLLSLVPLTPVSFPIFPFSSSCGLSSTSHLLIPLQWGP